MPILLPFHAVAVALPPVRAFSFRENGPCLPFFIPPCFPTFAFLPFVHYDRHRITALPTSLNDVFHLPHFSPHRPLCRGCAPRSRIGLPTLGEISIIALNRLSFSNTPPPFYAAPRGFLPRLPKKLTLVSNDTETRFLPPFLRSPFTSFSRTLP